MMAVMVAQISEVFLVFLRLGCTSFGGPIAHLSYFHDEFVTRKKWLDEHSFADLVALCQFLPGPASSQLGIALGLTRAGLPGAVAGWIGFTLPSAILLTLFGLGVETLGDHLSGPWLHGLKVVAVAVVAQALWGMATKLCPDRPRASIAIAAAVIVAISSSALVQVAVIALGGVLGWLFLRKSPPLPQLPMKTNVSQLAGATCLAAFALLLVGLPVLASLGNNHLLQLFDSFYRAGALVFGGGHVVLPLLQAEVVQPGWVSRDAFMAGYGAAQAVPGPLFTFTAYLGAVAKVAPAGWLGAGICLIASFLPSFLLTIGAFPFWEKLRKFSAVRLGMQGTNAAVVGLLLSAFYHPVWTSGILSPQDFALAAADVLLLVFWQVPPWLVVLGSALVSGVLAA